MAYAHASTRTLIRTALIPLCMLLLAFAASAYAQEDERPEDVRIDEEVSVEDVGAGEARILPDSPLHAFKRFGRAIQEIVTVNPIRKTEVRLEHANQELAEAKQLLESEEIDERRAQAARRSIERYEGKIEKITGKIESFRERKEAGDERVDALLDDVIDKQIKHQKILEQAERAISEHAPEDVRGDILAHIQSARERVAQHAGEFVGGVDHPDDLEERLIRIMDEQRGSDFKDFKNAAIIRHMEEFAPEEVRDIFKSAQEERMREMAQEMERMTEEERGRRFEQYVKNAQGSEVRYIEMMERLKNTGVPDDVRARIEGMKRLQAQRFKERLDALEDTVGDDAAGLIREQALEQFNKADVERTRALKEIQDRVEFENEDMRKKMEDVEREQVKRFAETFTDETSQGQAERYRKLKAQLAENPDPATFRLLQQLEEEVMSDPQKRAFIAQLEQETKEAFRDRIERNAEQFAEQFATSNPEDLELINRLREEFGERPEAFGEGRPPAELEQFFERARQENEQRIIERLQNTERPEEFERFKERFENVDDAAHEALRGREEFGRLFEEHEERLREHMERRMREDDERAPQFEFDATNDPFCDEACQERERARREERMRDEENERPFDRPFNEEVGQPPGEGFERPFDGQFDERRPPQDERMMFENRDPQGIRNEQPFEDRRQFDDRRTEPRFDEPPREQPQSFRHEREERRESQGFKSPPKPEEVFERLNERAQEVRIEADVREIHEPPREQDRAPVFDDRPEPRIEARDVPQQGFQNERPQQQPQENRPQPSFPVQIQPAPPHLEQRDIPPQSAVQRYITRMFGTLVIRAAMAGW